MDISDISGPSAPSAPPGAPPPTRNQILAALPAADYQRLLPQLHMVELELGHSLYESGGQLEHVYFPVQGIVSLLYVTQAGSSAELAVVGNEGLIGVSLFMGGETTPNRAVVQSKVIAYRLAAATLKNYFAEGGAMQVILLRYTQALITQISQTAVCNLHHSVDQQLCRWLLLTLDRLPGSKVAMTQQLIGNMLGVRRDGVVDAMDRLQESGAMRYTGGNITVLNRAKLERLSCECYSVVKNEIKRLFALDLPAQPQSRPKLSVVSR